MACACTHTLQRRRGGQQQQLQRSSGLVFLRLSASRLSGPRSGRSGGSGDGRRAVVRSEAFVVGGLYQARNGGRNEEAGALAQLRQAARQQAAGASMRDGAAAGTGAHGAVPR
jgi:hypothetical protein